MAFTASQKRKYRATLEPGACSGRSGKSGKSGKSGRSGRSGRSGWGLSQHDAARQKRKLTRRRLLWWILACLPDTIQKLHGATKAAACSKSIRSRKGVRAFQALPMFAKHRRLEINPEFDSTSLELYARCLTLQPIQRIVLMWLTRLLFQSYTCLEPFLTAYKAKTRTDFWTHVSAGAVQRTALKTALASVTLGAAMQRMRLAQWQSYRRAHGYAAGTLSFVHLATAAFMDLQATNAWREAAASWHSVHDEATAENLWLRLDVRTAFLRCLLYRDMRVVLCRRLPISMLVGPGARRVLLDSCAGLNLLTHEDMLRDLNTWILARLPLRWSRLVAPYGWDATLTQHQCCELRRFEDHVSSGTGRLRCSGAMARQQRRQVLLGQLYHVLGFKTKLSCSGSLFRGRSCAVAGFEVCSLGFHVSAFGFSV